MPPKHNRTQTPPAPLQPFIAVLSMILDFLKTIIHYSVVTYGMYLTFRSIQLLAGISDAKIVAIAGFVKELGLAWKVLVPGVVLATGAVGILSYRNNRLVRRLDAKRQIVEANDPENSSSGLDRNGRMR